MIRRCLLAAVLLLPALPATPQQAGEIAVYSSRHYDTDRELYDSFTRETGIRLRLIEGDADQLIARIQAEGANSPADVLITVDAARLGRARDAGVLRPIRSAVLEARIPASLRDPEGHWFGVSRRARVLVYDRARGLPDGLARYEDLADPRLRGQICTRAAAHAYSVSLTASVLAANGPAATEAWARGVVANLARPPQGGDRDQIRGVAAGQCAIGVANTYYLAQMAVSPRADDREVAARIAVLFPNQAPGDRGAHVNISGAGVVRTAPNPAGAQAFIEHLTSRRAQEIFAVGNMEYPVVEDATIHPALLALGSFRGDGLDAARLAADAATSLQILQRAGWR